MSSLYDFVGPVAVLKGADLNSANNTDIAITVPNGYRKWTPRLVVVTNASADLSGGSLQFGIYTAVAEGGKAIVSKGVNSATSLTAATKQIKPTIASQTDALQVSTVYLHIDVANGAAATADFYIFGDVLP